MIASAMFNSQGGHTQPSDFLPKFGGSEDIKPQFIDPATVDNDAIQRKIGKVSAMAGGRR
jgi:hypothetical protein